MDQDNNKIYCPKCGNEMNSNSRYCMKCGFLNANNEANQNIQSYIPKVETSSYQIGQGQVINQESNQVTTAIASNTGNSIFCFLLNFFVYVLIIGLGFIFSMRGLDITLENIKISVFPYIALISSVVFLFVYSLQLIFIKCNKRWWSVFIPIYNLMILSDITFKKKWLGLLTLIPVIGQVLFLVMLYKLGTQFKYNGLLTMLFAPVMIPIIGFGTRLYESTTFVSRNDNLEKDYKRKKLFLTLIILFIIFGALFIFWNNIIETKTKAKKLSNYYYVYASNRIVDKTKRYINNNYLECDDYDYSNDRGTYYIYYSDIGNNIYLPFYYMREAISGYVVVDNNNGSSKYYVSMSDGYYGFDETLLSEVNINTIVEYKEIIPKDKDKVNYCTVNIPKIIIG